jgi:thiol-disulfide isomerase/thioredoxin
MKTRLIVLLVLLYGLTGIAQHVISGNFTPATEFKWLIAYELTPGGQRYMADTAIKNGYFKLELPENAAVGMYRIVYAVPQDDFFIDVIYNGKEDIEFNFNLEDGMTIVASKENKVYYNYFSEITSLERQLVDFYEAGATSKKKFKELTKNLSEVQARYEGQGSDLLVHQLIKTNAPYLPDSHQDSDRYFKTKKKRYFDAVDFNSRFLQSSELLKQKLSNYVFTVRPVQVKTTEATQSTILANIEEIAEKLGDSPIPFKTAIFQMLWRTANKNKLHRVSDTIFSRYLKDLATQNGDQALIDEIELSSRLRIGVRSPEISWEEDGTTKKLSGLEGAEQYVLVFWSSTCSHCLKELPALHRALASYQNVKVVAVGLEDDDTHWKQEKGNLPNFEHAIALGKWESDYAQLFGIQQTPTYFVLDTNKRFVAQPENDKQVVSVLNREQ